MHKWIQHPEKTLGLLDCVDCTTQTSDSNKSLPDFRKNWPENMPRKEPKRRRVGLQPK